MFTEFDNRRLFDVLFQNPYQAILIIDVSKNSKILDANTKALQLFKYSLIEIKNLTIFDLIKETKDDINNLLLKKDSSFEIEEEKFIDKFGNIIPIKSSFSFISSDDTTLAISLVCDLTLEKEREEVICINEKRYKAIVEDQSELICRFDKDGKLTFVNNAYCKYFDQTYEELIGKYFLDLIPEESKEFVKNSISVINYNNQFNCYDHKVALKNGEVRWMHWSDRGIFDKSRNIVEYQSIGIDITDRKKLETKLIKSTLKYKGILNSLQDGFYRVNDKGNITYISCSALEIIGYGNRQDIIRQPIESFFVDPSEFRKIFHKLKSAGGKIDDQETEIYINNNKKITIRYNAQFVYNEKNEIVGTQGTFKDITEQKKRMKEIIKLYQVVENIQSGILILSPDGTIEYANPMVSKITKLKTSVIGKKLKTFINFDSSINQSIIFNSIDQTGKWFGPAYCLQIDSNYERVPIDIMFSKFIDSSGNLSIIVSFTDVSERYALMKKIKEQSQMYEELHANMLVLVNKMDEFNVSKFEKINKLEKEYSRSMENIGLARSL